ncbi:MAG: AraC family transcriptional regulator [Bacteroidetes bacterium]|nr:AraC family transcriptional regulator [Bacteroidota bacterium]
MKVLPFTIPKPKRDALILQEDKQASFYEFLHQHEELQISLIVQGQGTLIVGDSLGVYNTGDVIILAGNLPHVFKSNIVLDQKSHMLSVFFTETSFGDGFFDTEELKSLSSFFKKAENGFKVISPGEKIINIFQKLQKVSKLDRFILFFELLKRINNAKYEVLSSFISEKKYTDNEGQRMSAVFQYTMTHFREKISLEKISREAAMTTNAFCKYFKKRTRKTYITFLNELRIEEACKFLREQTEMSIAEIAEHSGFQNISNFNRKFKQLKFMTPREYSNQHS